VPAPRGHPIRPFTDWDDARPGFVEVDLVAHCGRSTQGFSLCPLCAVDIATAWVELDAVGGKGPVRVGGAGDHVRTRLPMPLVGLDSDNGSEFINRSLVDYCRRSAITFPRRRAWKKHDSAHVEQKNGAIVRRRIGYDRFATRAAYAQLTRVYQLARLHVTFFQPVEQLVTKSREGARVHRVYLQLRRDLDAALDRLWTLAAPNPLRPQRDTQIATPSLNSSPGGSSALASVTLNYELTRPGG
jgi:hypothetical protein